MFWSARVGGACMYIQALVGDYRQVAELVGICDINAGSTRFYADRARQQGPR